MIKLPNFINENRTHHSEDSDLFENFTQLTIKIEENYHTGKENEFRDIIHAKKDVLNLLICYVKLIQGNLKYDNHIFIRFWRDTVDERRCAYTIAVSNLDESINQIFFDLCKNNIKDTQSVNLNYVLTYYQNMCSDKISKLYDNLENTNYEINSKLELVPDCDEIMEELTFLSVFSYENTESLLSNGDYEPIVDFSIKKPEENFYFEAFGRSTFPWYFYNGFEREAKVFMEKIEIEQNVYHIKTKSLSILGKQYKHSRFDWKTKNEINSEIDDDVNELLGGEEEEEEEEIEETNEIKRKKMERKIENRKRKKKENRRKTKLKLKKKRKSPEIQYFQIPKRKKEPKPNRICRLAINELGVHQYLKEGLNLLNQVIIKQDDYMNDLITKEDIYKRKKMIFDDFWVSHPIQTILPNAVKSVHKHFKKTREKFELVIIKKDSGLIHNILIHLIESIHTIIGLRSTDAQFIMQLFSRDSCFNDCLDPLGFNVYVAGPPSAGKSHAMSMLNNASIPGTILFNSMSQSAKAGLGARNPDNYALVIETDAGPIFTEKWDNLDPSQKRQIKATVAEMSEGKKEYNVFVPGNGKNESNDPFVNRGDTIRITNENKGASNIIGNALPTVPEFIDRVNFVDVGSSNKNFSSMLCKIANDLMKSFDVHNRLQDTFFDFLKNIQSDVAFYNLYKTSGCSPDGVSYNIITAMLIVRFCLKRLEERHPFFINSPRKINSIMFIAINLCSYKTKVLLSNLKGGKFFGKEKIHPISDFCHEFAKRMIVGYEEIIPSLFIMLPQFVDNQMIDILKVIKECIFKYKYEVRENNEGNHLRRYFRDVINEENNKINDHGINFRVLNAKVYKKKNRVDFTNNTWDDGDENEDGGNTLKFYVDPNYLTFETEKTNKEFITVINNFLEKKFGYRMSEEIIETKLDKLSKKHIDIEKKYKEFECIGIERNPYSKTSHIQTELDERYVKKKEQCLYHRYIDRKNIYRFPIELFDKLDSISSYDILKNIVEKELPYKNQGGDIEVVGIKFPSLKMETLVLSQEFAKNENFIINNPKFMNPTEQLYYQIIRGCYDKSDEELDENKRKFFKTLISEGILAFDYPIVNLSYQIHETNFGVDEINEIRGEERRLINNQSFQGNQINNDISRYNMIDDEIMDILDDTDNIEGVRVIEEEIEMENDDEQMEMENDDEQRVNNRTFEEINIQEREIHIPITMINDDNMI